MARKLSGASMMASGGMTGRYIFVEDGVNLNAVCRGLRGAYKECTFKVVMGDRISVSRKDGREITAQMMDQFSTTIVRLQQGDK